MGYVRDTDREPATTDRGKAAAAAAAAGSKNDFDHRAGDTHTPPSASTNGDGDGASGDAQPGDGKRPAFAFVDPAEGRGERDGERGTERDGRGVRPGAGAKGKGKRGRKPGKKPIFRPTAESQKPTAQKISADLGSIEGLLLSIHMVAASVSKIPELNLDPSEAQKLAASIQRVAEQYDIAVAQRTLAWIDLSVTVGGIYGTRAYAYHLRMQAERGKKIGPVAVPSKQPQQQTGA